MSGGSLFSDSGMFGDAFGGVSEGTGINLSGIPFVGGLFPDPNQKAMREALMNASNQMALQRQQSAAGFQNLAGQMLSAYAPAQNALSQMYGGGGAPQAAASSPVSSMVEQGISRVPMPSMNGGSPPSNGNGPGMLNQAAGGLGTMTLGGGPFGLLAGAGVDKLRQQGGMGGALGGALSGLGMGKPWGPLNGVFG